MIVEYYDTYIETGERIKRNLTCISIDFQKPVFVGNGLLILNVICDLGGDFQTLSYFDIIYIHDEVFEQ